MPPESQAGAVRPATAADAAAIATLHAGSWRASYRGSYSDIYLDGPVATERDRFWRQRLAQPGPALVTLVLDGKAGAALGFICGVVDDDPCWGTLIDNLHVEGAHKGTGLGRRLMRAFADHLRRRTSVAPVHLFALASNGPPRSFYARLGGTVVERLVQTEPDGRAHPVDRMAWPTLSAFLDGVA